MKCPRCSTPMEMETASRKPPRALYYCDECGTTFEWERGCQLREIDGGPTVSHDLSSWDKFSVETWKEQEEYE